jgi:hypothetical protein
MSDSMNHKLVRKRTPYANKKLFGKPVIHMGNFERKPLALFMLLNFFVLLVEIGREFKIRLVENRAWTHIWELLL